MADETITPEQRWCPAKSGRYLAYEVQTRARGEEKWIGFRAKIVREGGIPGNKFDHGINHTLGLMSYEQAMAIAWGLKAEAVHEDAPLDVRVMPYEVVYDCKARALEGQEEFLYGDDEGIE